MKPALAVLLVALLLWACSDDSSPWPSPPGGKPAAGDPAAPAGGKARERSSDPSAPILTDARMEKFIESMQEEHNPLGILFGERKPGERPPSLMGLAQKVKELDAFAQKYGFRDYAEYAEVWGRITIAEMGEVVGEMQARSAAGMVDMTKQMEAQAANPELPAEVRAEMLKQVEDMKKQQAEIAAAPPADLGIPAADYEMIKKYKARIDEARKRWTK